MATEGLPLRIGAEGDAVLDLQRRLIATGFELDETAGHFGPSTETAVRHFQKTRGLVVDGICGKDTWTALDADVKGDA